MAVQATEDRETPSEPLAVRERSLHVSLNGVPDGGSRAPSDSEL